MIEKNEKHDIMTNVHSIWTVREKREGFLVEIQSRLQQVCRQFRIPGEFVGYEKIKDGNVNQTYKVFFNVPEGYKKAFIVQKVNTYAFQNPEQLMDNADLITEYIRVKKKGLPALHYHHTEDRKTYVYDDEGGFWRLSNFIASRTFNSCAGVGILRETGRAFGEFQRLLTDFPAERLNETIPDFHNTPKRLQSLFENAEKDPVGRAAQVQEELSYIQSVRVQAERMTRLYEAGLLPLRVTHNDTKINNVLFDRDEDRALAIIDLDTVMPGLVGHDFGDAVRFAANTVEEDCKEYTRASCDLDLFRGFAEGFLEQTGDVLTQEEKDTLALSVFTLAVELAARFLDDYLVGDRYFNIDYPQHNLVRARCQLALAKDIHAKLDRMQQIIDACMK